MPGAILEVRAYEDSRGRQRLSPLRGPTCRSRLRSQPTALPGSIGSCSPGSPC
jgi:hypothetical protein